MLVKVDTVRNSRKNFTKKTSPNGAHQKLSTRYHTETKKR